MNLQLKGFEFAELLTAEGLQRLDLAFLAHLKQHYGYLHDALLNYRAGQYSSREASDVIVSVAPILEHFIAELFAIVHEVDQARLAVVANDVVFAFKQYYVAKEAKRGLRKLAELPAVDELDSWLRQALGGDISESALAEWGMRLLENAERHADDIQRLTQWCTHRLSEQMNGSGRYSDWVLFRLPKKVDFEQLVPCEPKPDDPLGRLQAPQPTLRQRDGFELTDERYSQREALSEIDYCVYCHEKEGDFCSKGFPVKKGQPERGFKLSPLNETLTGCPLEEKISEMQWLKKLGYTIGALATVMIDNPMCPATGHRICNDCMKSCIYQKQDPVNIPQAETRVLTDVLALPWGVELYDLLTRWNPLRQRQYLLQPYNGLKVLVMGMGPAGFSLAHHLLMEGFAVVGADGLKIEPLPEHYIHQPIYAFDDLKESLSERVMTGFGGVAEYGITVRWDKNFLKLILISLLRRSHFQLVGSVRFGGTLTIEDAWSMGFDHLAIAVGAGLPKELNIPNSLAPGMRQANDFLMALQLTGAAKHHSLASLQVRLPAVVIGGGLTGIDAATEVQAYYLVQIERTARRYDALVAEHGEQALRSRFDASDLSALDEMLGHARELATARLQAQQAGEALDTVSLLRRWGGVTVVYRRSMQESPAYQRNHEELSKALEEGIYYAEGLSPETVVLDEFGHVKALQCQSRIKDADGHWVAGDLSHVIPARSILVATGAKPNVAYAFEHKAAIVRRQFEYARFDRVEEQLVENQQAGHVKMPAFGPFTSYDKDHCFVSFLGDTHPVFHGSVVNAIASAQRVYPHIVDALQEKKVNVSSNDYDDFSQTVEQRLRSYVCKVVRKTDRLLELTVRSPQSASRAYPGQFYRLQTYESQVESAKETPLHMEALSAIGIVSAAEPDQLRFIVRQDQVGAKIAARFKEGQRLSLMGPTGAKFIVPEQACWLVVGAELALAQVLALAPEFARTGGQLLYFSTLSESDFQAYESELRACLADVCRLGSEQDFERAVLDYQQQQPARLAAVSQVQIFGSAALIQRIQSARHRALSGVFATTVKFVGSVFGPMQCMLKGVCAQCLQWQIDPETGERKKAVYACSWQTQPMEMIDIDNLNDRFRHNHLQEKLNEIWLDHCL